MDRQATVWLELRHLTETLKGFGEVEAAIRLRALTELAASLDTDALLHLVLAHAEDEDEDEAA